MKVLILKGGLFGIYKVEWETRNCYYILDQRIQRKVGVLKNKWYVIKLPYKGDRE